MAQVFLSYAREDADRARALAAALATAGVSVWWDRTIPPGRQFDEVIEEELHAARCVVVLWSKASAASKWVKTEATVADQRGILIPVLLEPDVRVPLAFTLLQAADLSAWRGGADEPAFHDMLAAIRRHVPEVAARDGDEAQDRPDEREMEQEQERERDDARAKTPPGERGPWFAGIRRWASIAVASVIVLGTIGFLVANILDPLPFRPDPGTDTALAAQPVAAEPVDTSRAHKAAGSPGPTTAAPPQTSTSQPPRSSTPAETGAATRTPVNRGATVYLGLRTVTGTVISEATGQPIADAVVTLVGTNVGTMTGADGTFSISVPRADTVLVIRYIGYQQTRVPVPAGTAGLTVRMR